jgi:hypothetical protein
MAVYTTNWNLYRTHFKSTVNEYSNVGYSRNRLSKVEENKLLEQMVEELHDI